VSDRCPYCSDYKELKQELEETKRNAEKETKDSLKKCECEKKKLRSKLIKLGIIIIIAGTLLGKEFVDKVSEYLDSFNKIKETSSELISNATPIERKPASTSWPSFPKKRKGFDPISLSSLKTKNIQLYEEDLTKSLDTTLVLPLDPTVFHSFKSLPYFDETLNDFNLDWSTYLLYETSKELIPLDVTKFEDPLNIQFYYASTIPSPASPIPGPGVLMSLAIGLVFIKKRKR
tara:strand:- start:4535 stop:5230 length:696 start_codon:yes stop_codon:yes gene_type:complete